MKRLIIIVLFLSAIAAGGYLYVTQLLAPREVPQAVLEAENAIALSGTVAIASIDMDYVKRIDREINGKDDPSPLLNPDVSDTFLGLLQEQGVNPIKQTDYAILAMSIAKDNASYAAVLLGDYSTDSIKQVIREKYMVRENQQGYWLIQIEDVRTCKLSSPTAIDIQKNRILIASPKFMPTLTSRLKNKEAAGVDLTKWREFRSDKVFAGAILVPENISKGATDFFTRGLLQKRVDEQPLESIYAGAVVNLLPPQGLKLLIDISSTEPTWAKEIEDKYNKWVVESADNLKELPTLAGLMQYMSVEADGTVLRAQVVADSDLLDNWEKVPKEFIDMMFSGMKMSMKPSGDSTSQANAEKVIEPENLVKFKPQMSFADIALYDAKNTYFKPDVISGPFSITISEIGLLAKNDNVVQFTLKVDGKGVDNITVESMHTSSASSPAMFEILSVEDSQGNNLLREERCGKELNTDKKALNASSYLEKKLRLQEGVSFNKVAKIKARVSLELATKTKTQTINAPFADKVIETDKVRIFFKDGGDSNIQYDVSGNQHHILAVRSKNAKGQYLASNGSSAFGDVSKKSITKNIQGKVASIEIIYAEETQSKDFLFEIDGLTPKFKVKSEWDKAEPHTVRATTKEKFELSIASYNYPPEDYMGISKDKNLVKAGPFMIKVDEVKDYWGRKIGGYFYIYGPDSPTLWRNMSAVELVVDELITTDGETKPFNVTKNTILERSGVGRTDNLQYYLSEPSTGMLSVNYEDNPHLKNIKVKKVKGKVKVKLPKKLYRLSIDGYTLGAKKKSRNGLVAKLAGFKNNQIIIELQGSVDKIVQMRPKNAKGEVLYATAKLAEKQINTWGLSKEEKAALENQPKTWEAHVSMYEQPATIDILYANDFDTIEYPFELNTGTVAR